MHLTVQRRRPTRIKIDKLRFLSTFPEKQYNEKAPGAGAQSGVFPDVRSRRSVRRFPGRSEPGVVPDDRSQAKTSAGRKSANQH